MPQMADVRVRQAMSLALDRAGIATAILRELKAAATQLFPPILAEWHVPAPPPLTRNLDRARELMRAAGWQLGADGMLTKNGKPFTVTVRTFPDRPELPPIATALQAEFKTIGINLQVAKGNSSDIPAGHQDGPLELALLARNYALVPDPIGTLVQDFSSKGGDWAQWAGAALPSSRQSTA